MSAVLSKKRKKRPSFYVKKTLLYTASIIIIILALFPFLWVLLSSFKPLTEIQSIEFKFFPAKWTIENYKGLFIGNSIYFPRGSSFLKSILMTLIVTLSSLILSLSINSLAAYAFARLKFPLKKVFWTLYAINMFVPNIAVLIPCYFVVTKMGLINNILVLILPGVSYIWSVFFYRQFYYGVPRELEEAALIDGCSRVGVYFRIFVPLSITPFIIMGLSVFQGFWNSYIWPSMTVYGNPDLFQVNQLIAYFRNSQGTAWDMLLAGTVISSIPSIIILIVMNKYLSEGIKITGIK